MNLVKGEREPAFATGFALRARVNERISPSPSLSIPFLRLILGMEENKAWEAGPNLFSSSADSSRNFRDAVMGIKKPDRAIELLRAHVLSKFVMPPSDLSHAEIVSRQGRAEADNLTAQKRGFKDGLLQGVIPLTQ